MTFQLNELFRIDELAKVVITLILFIGLIVAIFAKNYLKGDKKYLSFFWNLAFMILSIVAMVASDNIILFACFCYFANFQLYKLMIHKKEWHAAHQSGILAAKHFIFGFICLSIAIYLIYHNTHELSISALTHNDAYPNDLLTIPLILILIAAMTQSAIWPFHSWLTSSLNSPTPVSAIMHAGLVNGGGIMLARFAPLYLHHGDMLTIIFVIGIITSIIGIIWKLIQSDIKKMLACSTMSQMGFMMAQCGLGLFPAAIAHLFWHGCFKSYLFLSSNSVFKEKRLNNFAPNYFSFVFALAIGCLGALIFAYATNIHIENYDTSFVLIFLAFIAASQIALACLNKNSVSNLAFAATVTSLCSFIYGKSVYLVEYVLFPLQIFQPQKLNEYHIAAMLAIFTLWIMRLFMRNIFKEVPESFIKIYVKALNASQPRHKTITATRQNYKL